MSETLDQEKEIYLRNIIYLNIQKKEMIELTKNSIKGQEPIKCKLINKDIINEYMNDSISNQIYLDLEKYKINKKIDKYSELYDEIHIKNIINEKKKKINDIDLADKFFNPTLLMVEYSKTNNIEYPFNFFIIRTSVFDQIMGVVGSVLVEFKTYDVLIGKEGIFIWDEKPNEINGFKFIIYYIKDIKTDEEYTINKIILLKEKTTKYIENLDKYLKLTELKEKSGYFNIIDDGKIIGKYLNIIKNTNYQYRERKIDLEESKMKAEILNLEKKSQDFDSYIQTFLPYILLSLSSINKLNQYFLNKENINEKNDLIKTFINIIKKLASNKDDLVSDIYDFIDIFNKRNLFEKFEMPENKKDIWEIFINLLLDEFQKELKKKEKNKIFDIFNGIQKINSTEKSFKTMDIKGSAIGNIPQNLGRLIDLYKTEENVESFPKVMIIFIYDERDLILIPREFKLEPSKNENEIKIYKLRSFISLSDSENVESIVRNKNSDDFYKLKILTEENKIKKEKIEDISKGFIYFYEIEQTVNNENINKNKINNNNQKDINNINLNKNNNINNINNNINNNYQYNNICNNLNNNLVNYNNIVYNNNNNNNRQNNNNNINYNNNNNYNIKNNNNNINYNNNNNINYNNNNNINYNNNNYNNYSNNNYYNNNNNKNNYYNNINNNNNNYYNNNSNNNYHNNFNNINKNIDNNKFNNYNSIFNNNNNYTIRNGELIKDENYYNNYYHNYKSSI